MATHEIQWGAGSHISIGTIPRVGLSTVRGAEPRVLASGEGCEKANGEGEFEGADHYGFHGLVPHPLVARALPFLLAVEDGHVSSPHVGP